MSTKARRRVVILGSTGSIGTQALEVIARANREQQHFDIVGLAAGTNVVELARQAVATGAPTLGITADRAQELRDILHAQSPGYAPTIVSGPHAATELARVNADVVLNGITGSIGLTPTLAALHAGATLALANKESLVAGGPLVRSVAADGQIVPVDSEHSALAQCLRAGATTEVERLILTASGGPFRGMTRAELASKTPREALAHPTWDMGPMVTTNSATMVNKALEVIESHVLFDIPLEHIDVVVHPQSVVHSMVQFIDGSTIAHASPPDMRIPIGLALGWPQRIPHLGAACDWTKASQWFFEPLDQEAFPAVRLAKAAVHAGGTHPAVFNAANEEAVHAFHANSIGFLDILAINETVLAEHTSVSAVPTLEDIHAAEQWARRRAQECVATIQ